MRKILFILALIIYPIFSFAQNPKWIEKAKRGIVSIATYDKDGKLLKNGNGFFIDKEGTILSNYELFKNASRAKVITSDNKTYNVSYILGANDIYDLIKIKAENVKKVYPLDISSKKGNTNDLAFILPYSTKRDRSCIRGHIQSTDSISGNYGYYTINASLKEQLVSCPVMNEEGEVIALAQVSTSASDNNSYAIDVNLAKELSINPLSFNSLALSQINITKGLPSSEKDATVYIYMAASKLNAEEYIKVLNLFIDTYPENADGYVHRANFYLAKGYTDENIEKANKDMSTALDVAKHKDNVHFSRSKQILNYLLTAKEQNYKEWNYQEALKEIQKAYEIKPLDIYTQVEGDIYVAKKDYAKADSCYTIINNSKISSESTLFAASRVKLALNDTIGAIATLDTLIERSTRPVPPRIAPYFLEKAKLNLQLKKYRIALKDYDAYQSVMKGIVDAPFYYERSQVAVLAKQFQRALNDIDSAVQKAPTEALYYTEKGSLNLRVGRYQEAIKALEKSIELDSEIADNYRLMGVCYVQLKKESESCKYFKKAIEKGDKIAEKLLEKFCKK